MNNEAIHGVVFNIQRYSIHDGPGIRTTVFLKGCPLRCFWCQNPESQNPQPEILYNEDACTGCGRCTSACPHGANRSENAKSILDRALCDGCGKCAAVCAPKARSLQGKTMAVDDIVTVVLKDRAMYNKSGGGLTLSGGEPTMQPEFSLALLRACREEGLHTAIETCGQTKWERLRELLHYTDYLFYDIKTLDSEKHRKGAGTGNERILENARKAAQIETLHMHVRSPMIPGYNDSKEDVTTIARFVTEELGLRSDRYTILRYNKYAEGKFSRLGRTAEQIHLEPQPVEYIESLNDIIRSF